MVGDPAIYRSKEEVKEWKGKDPITKLEKYLLENNIIGIEKIEEIRLKCKKAVREANDYALNSPEPQFEDMFRDIYYEGCMEEGVE